MNFAKRTDHLKPEGAYAVLASANQLEAEGRDIVHLEIGQPDFATAGPVSEAAIEAIRGGQTKYNPPVGIPPHRQTGERPAGYLHRPRSGGGRSGGQADSVSADPMSCGARG